MSIIRWEPARDLMSLREAMDRLFEDSFIKPTRALGFFAESGTPTLDMYHTDKDVVVKATLPGVKPEEVEISITGDTLSISGETKTEEEVKKENYFYQERRFGSFKRAVTLPSGLKTDKADATFENGVLTVTLPKAEEAKPKQIKVKAKQSIEGKKA